MVSLLIIQFLYPPTLVTCVYFFFHWYFLAVPSAVTARLCVWTIYIQILHQSVVWALSFCGVKQLVLRGVNHNWNVGSLVSLCESKNSRHWRQCLSYNATLISRGCETDFLEVRRWQTSQRYTGLNWEDKYHRLHSLALQRSCIHHPKFRLTTSSRASSACRSFEIFLVPIV